MPLPSEASTDDNRTTQETALPTRQAADSSVILSPQQLMSDTQAQSRLAVLRQGLAGEGRTWRRASYRLAALPVPGLLPHPIFGGLAGFSSKPTCRMPANPLFAARSAFGDTSVNAKQEGTP
jgi:hypothetical protein